VGLEPETTVAPDRNSSSVDPEVLAHVVPEGSSLNDAIELIMVSDVIAKEDKQQYICALHAEATEEDATTTAAPCVPVDEEHDVALIVVLVIALVLLFACILAIIALILCLRGEKRRQKFELDELQGLYEGELRKCRAQLKEERLQLQAREAAAKEVEGRVGTACKEVLDQALSASWPSPEIKKDLRQAAAVGKVASPAFLPAERVLEVALKALQAQGAAEAELKAKIEDLETQSTTSSLPLAFAGHEAVDQVRMEADELRAQVGSLEAQLAEANQERNVLQAATAVQQKAFDTCRETSREKEKSRKLLQGRTTELAAQVERLSGELAAARAECDSLREQRAVDARAEDARRGAEDDRAVLRLLLRGAEDNRSRLELALAEGQSRLDEMAKRLEVAEKEKASAEQHLAACTKHIAGLRSAAHQREQHQADQLAVLERRLAHQTSLVESLTVHNGDADRLVAGLRAEIQQREARLARWHEVAKRAE
jgi:septal ring factor EnvC (AmiA/AmiB activator)